MFHLQDPLLEVGLVLVTNSITGHFFLDMFLIKPAAIATAWLA